MARRYAEESGDSLQKDTIGGDTSSESQRVRRMAALTVAWHPDPRRVGGRCFLAPTSAAEPVAVWRGAPLFLEPGGALADPLSDRRISRSPLLVSIDEDMSVTLDARETAMRVLVDGVRLEGIEALPAERVAAGVSVELAGRVALVLHHADWTLPRAPRAGLVGECDAILRVRSEIQAVAAHTAPVLVVGETGTGKHLVAQAIHAAGERRTGPFVHVHLPPPPGLSDAAALFGCVERPDRPAADGWFQQAEGGTLFADNLDEAPADVQLLLQQVLESGTYHRVGASRAERGDVRVIAAGERVASLFDRLRPGLLYRLARYEIVLPPLRERREDIGRLLLHFLREELEESGHGHRLAPVSSREHPWLSARIVSRLVSYDWPGNVLQLRNAAAQIALEYRDVEFVSRKRIEALLFDDAPPSSPIPPSPRTMPKNISVDELVRAMDDCGWNYSQAARSLGIARNSLYAALRRHGFRRPIDLSAAEVRRAVRAADGDVDAAARRLRVSPSGLQRRVQELDRGSD